MWQPGSIGVPTRSTIFNGFDRYWRACSGYPCCSWWAHAWVSRGRRACGDSVASSLASLSGSPTYIRITSTSEFDPSGAANVNHVLPSLQRKFPSFKTWDTLSGLSVEEDASIRRAPFSAITIPVK